MTKKSLRNRRIYFSPSSPFQSSISLPWCLKGLWDASAHVRSFDFSSSEPFFKIAFWWTNPLPSALRRPWKLLYQYSRVIIWSILEVLNVIFCIFVQALSRKFEVFDEKCTKPYSLLSVFLQTDQIWCLKCSTGLLSSPVNDLPFPDSFWTLNM